MEILVVFVIMGILTTIGVVYYKGAQERSQNAVIASAVKSYGNAVTLYRANKGYWPPAPASAAVKACLGVAASYSSTYGSLTSGKCNTAAAADVNTTFNSELASYIGNVPNLSFMKPMQFTPTAQYGRGIYYSFSCLISSCDYANTAVNKFDVRINYVIPATKTCTIGETQTNTPSSGFTTCTYVIQQGATS